MQNRGLRPRGEERVPLGDLSPVLKLALLLVEETAHTGARTTGQIEEVHGSTRGVVR